MNLSNDSVKQTPEEEFFEPGSFVALIIIIFMIITFNCLVIICICRYQFLWTITNRFILSLAIADLTVGISTAFYVILDWIVTLDEKSNTILYCFLRIGVLDICLTVSVTSLLGVTIDRYISIIYPLHYSTIVTSTRATLAILFIWSWSSFISLVPMIIWHNPPESCLIEKFLHKYQWLAQTLYYFIVVTIMALLYSKIFRVAWVQSRHLGMSVNKDDNLKLKMRVVKVFFIVFGAIILSLTPFYVIYTYFAMIGSDSYSCSWCLLVSFTDLLMIANSTMNPIIYAWKYRDFQRALRKLFGCKATPVTPHTLSL